MSKRYSPVEREAFEPAEEALPARSRKCGIALAQQVESVVSANGHRKMCIGFIGLDHTGQAMVSSLLKAGHHLMLYDPAGDIPEAVTSAGANTANSVEETCRVADVVFTMLRNDEVAEEVVLGPSGVVEGLRQHAIHIGSSTVSVECSDRIVEAHWNAGKQYVSAPVLARGDLGEEQLLVIAAGREATIIRIEPLLRQIGQLGLLSGWPSDANLVQLGADSACATLSEFLAQHPDLFTRERQSQFSSPATPLNRILDIKIKGVL